VRLRSPAPADEQRTRAPDAAAGSAIRFRRRADSRIRPSRGEPGHPPRRRAARSSVRRGLGLRHPSPARPTRHRRRARGTRIAPSASYDPRR